MEFAIEIVRLVGSIGGGALLMWAAAWSTSLCALAQDQQRRLAAVRACGEKMWEQGGIIGAWGLEVVRIAGEEENRRREQGEEAKGAVKR